MSRHEQTALKQFLVSGNPAAVAKFITNTPKIQEHILTHCDGTSLEALCENLRSRNKDIVEAGREFLKDYLDLCDGKAPTQKLPAAVERKARMSAMAENFANVGPELAASAKSLFRNPIKSLTHLSAGITDAYAGTMSALGARESHRQILLSGVFAGTMVGLSGQANAAISQADISSALNDFNATAHSDTAGPVEITITGGHVELSYDNDYLLSPYLVQKMEKDPQARQYVAWIVDAAEKNGIDPVLFANQLFRESMHFKHSVVYGPDVSPAGAMGIGQFMDYTGPQYGLKETADYFNPEKAIYAAARMMSDLTDDYNNDQVLALAAYNGGPGAVSYVVQATGDNNLTGQEWLDFMDNRYEEIGETSKSAWHVETRKYIADITGQDWNANYKQWAVKLQGDDPIQYVENILSENPAVAAANGLALTPNNG